MVTKAARRASRLIDRIDKGWSQALQRLPEDLRLYHLKMQLQDYARRRGKEAIREELRSWGGADEEIIAWLLDTPLTLEDARQKSEELRITPQGRSLPDADASP